MMSTTVTLSARGPAATADVWERYCDLNKWSTWSPQIRSVRAEPMRLEPGLTGSVQPIVGPSISFEVLALDEASRTWSWRVRLPILPIALTLHHSVGPTTTGSATTLRVTGLLPIVMAYAPLARLALTRLVN